MKKLACLLITLFLSLAPISMAQADQPKDLVDWMPEYLSSDPPVLMTTWIPAILTHLLISEVWNAA